MADKSLDADGTNASALSEVTPLPGHILPTPVSGVEGSKNGIPAGNTAQLGVSPLTGAANNSSTSTSVQNILFDILASAKNSWIQRKTPRWQQCQRCCRARGPTSCKAAAECRRRLGSRQHRLHLLPAGNPAGPSRAVRCRQPVVHRNGPAVNSWEFCGCG